MNVQWSSHDLGDDWNYESSGDFSNFLVGVVLSLEVLGCLGCQVEGCDHGCAVTSCEKTNGTHWGGLWLGLATSAEFTSENRVSPCQQSNVCNGGCRNLELLASFWVLDLVQVESQFTQVGNSVCSKVHNHSKLERQPTKELLGLGDHLSRCRSNIAHESRNSFDFLDHALVHDGHERAHQHRRCERTSDFLRSADVRSFQKFMVIHGEIGDVLRDGHCGFCFCFLRF
mmetsp:Transcript_12473/g.18957  ORF Transcript_12473/g.18957 Transcript_12473/m.18957 type:complete len:228 (+) Transcript_12473:409-1092(+)